MMMTDLAETWCAALERAAQTAEIDADWTRFGKPNTFQFEDGVDPIREYRIGIAVGRAIAGQIRLLKRSPPKDTPHE